MSLAGTLTPSLSQVGALLAIFNHPLPTLVGISLRPDFN